MQKFDMLLKLSKKILVNTIKSITFANVILNTIFLP